jgi:hypothetical protein
VKNNAAPEKPKATIVRKVYVRKSRDLVKRVAEQGQQESKLKLIMVRVNDQLNGLKSSVTALTRNDNTKQMLISDESPSLRHEISVTDLTPIITKDDTDLLEVLTEITESCKNKQLQELKMEPMSPSSPLVIKNQESGLLSTEFNLTASAADVASPLPPGLS